MNNEISTTQKLEGMMRELIGINMDTAKKVDNMDSRISSIEKRTKHLEDDVQLTTQQRNTVRKAVHNQVLKVLGLPDKKSEWDAEDYVVSEKYSSIFHARCYVEVSSMGHLAKPYGDTTQQNFVPAIKDIEAWVPKNGIDGLKTEADKNRMARRTVYSF